MMRFLSDSWYFLAAAAGILAALLALGAAFFARDPWRALRLVFPPILRRLYRLRFTGAERIPASGGAILIANHQSYLDPALICLLTPRPVRFLMAKEMTRHWWARWMARATRAILISASDPPRRIIEALREARDEARRGGLVGLFPEGQITRTGMMLPFQRGLRQIVRDLDAPIIPLAIDGAWDTAFGPRRGAASPPLRRPGLRPAIRVVVGEPVASETPLPRLRQIIVELLADAFAGRSEDARPLHRAALSALRRRPFARLFSDHNTSRAITNLKWLATVAALGRRLARRWEGEERVGILLPPSLGGAAVNFAAALGGRVTVNLNYTASRGILEDVCARCAIRLVITSRAFLAKLRAFEPPGGVEFLYLEDLRGEIGARERLAGMARGWLWPAGALERALGRRRPAAPGDTLTILFSSGSTGRPKGVPLTHWNIGSNIEGACLLAHLDDSSRVLGILPFFHSYGLTVTLWLPLVKALGVSYYPTPLDARGIGETVQRHRVTHLFATPSFLSIYARRTQPGQFGSLTYAQTGAEKLRPAVAEAFEARFGLKPIEGYGATECSPVVTMNTCDYRCPGIYQAGARAGSVGHPLPGVALRVVDIETGETLPPGRPGMLLARGPNVMSGYFDAPELTAEVLRDGWYVTGDVAMMDDDGFVRITDRLSRFSKIAGEMVPHVKIEEALQELSGEPDRAFAVTGVADPKKGERLVALHTLPEAKAREVAAALQQSGLPAFWIPKWSDFLRVDEIPQLGAGKLDLQGVRALAARRLAEVAAQGGSQVALTPSREKR